MTTQTTVLTLLESGAVTTLSNFITHIGVGTDTTTPVVTDTQLGGETYRETLFTTSTTPNTYTTALYLDVTENSGNVVAEIGTFNASSSGTMASRNLTTVSTKTSSKEMYFDVKFTINALNN